MLSRLGVTLLMLTCLLFTTHRSDAAQSPGTLFAGKTYIGLHDATRLNDSGEPSNIVEFTISEDGVSVLNFTTQVVPCGNDRSGWDGDRNKPMRIENNTFSSNGFFASLTSTAVTGTLYDDGTAEGTVRVRIVTPSSRGGSNTCESDPIHWAARVADYQPQPGTAYEGTHERGGNLSFTIAADGRSIEGFRASNVPCLKDGEEFTARSVQITNLRLSYSISSGSFNQSFIIVNGQAVPAGGSGNTISSRRIYGKLNQDRLFRGELKIQEGGCDSGWLVWTAKVQEQ